MKYFDQQILERFFHYLEKMNCYVILIMLNKIMYSLVRELEVTMQCPSCGNEITNEKKFDLNFIQCIAMILVIVIPIVNIIMLLIWSLGSGSNPNKKNLSRALLFLSIVAYALFALIGLDVFSSFVGLS